MSALPAPAPSPSAAPRRGRNVLRALGIALLGATAASGTAGWLALRASLPPLDGEMALPGLRAPVTVHRDALGVPTVRGSSRVDVARALGFLHAQERFFQMDLMRRSAAGELSELAGPATLDLDRRRRVHRFRLLAAEVLRRASPEARATVEAYAAGVNAGLAALGARPFEYFLLRARPRPWQVEDTILVLEAMFLDLQEGTGEAESARGLLHDTLPGPLAEFVLPRGTSWDAPLVGPPLAVPPIPGPEVVDLRTPPARAASLEGGGAELAETSPGSNNWAVDGRHTASGAALVAGDMHLGLGVPNTWYRAAMVWPEGSGERRVVGVTLPGAPPLVAGSNGDVAWAFTNTEGDWSDLVVLEVDPADPRRYRTPEGWRPFEHHREVLRVSGAPDEVLKVTTTVWGPVVGRDHRGRPRALHWAAAQPEAVDLGLLRMEATRTVEEALEQAASTGIPHQNIVCADRSGRIGWTVIGRIPRRAGFDGRLPASWADGTRRWVGWLSAAEYPRVVDPPSGRLWSANARVADPQGLALVGDEGYDVGARQQQIRDSLAALGPATPADMLRIQLDDRALFLSRWRDLLLAELTPAALEGNPARAEARRLVESWGGRAAVDSAGYRIVREWRRRVARAVLEPLVAPARTAAPGFDYLGSFRKWEGPLWALVEARPAHLLPPPSGSWHDLLVSALDGTVAELGEAGPGLARRTWGERNTVRVQHPLGRALPLVGSWLEMPPRPLPGDSNMPRVQTPRFGASQRMAVSPGREHEGYFHMPAGQSGHPLSPHYRDGHAAWAEGQATPFLPGPPRHVLTLRP